jgi:hypothetical protein
MAWPIIEILAAHVPDALRHIGGDVDSVFDPALDEIAEGIIKVYQYQILAVGAIDTGWFINHVRLLAKGHRYRVVGAGPEVPYAGVVEHGWIERAKGQLSYPGRWPAARTIGMLEPIIGDAFAHQMWR